MKTPKEIIISRIGDVVYADGYWIVRWTMGVKVTLEQLRTEVPLPCVLRWNQNHFVVLYKVKNGKCYIADPVTEELRLIERFFQPLKKILREGL